MQRDKPGNGRALCAAAILSVGLCFLCFGQRAYATEPEQGLGNEVLVQGTGNELLSGENVVSGDNGEGNVLLQNGGEGNTVLEGSGEGNNELQNNGEENVLLQSVQEGTESTAQPVSYDVNAALYDQRETAGTPDGQDRPGREYPIYTNLRRKLQLPFLPLLSFKVTYNTRDCAVYICCAT